MSRVVNARLALFDIDNTLLSSGGAGRRAIKETLAEIYGTCGPVDGFPFAGKTDLQIISEILRQEGLSDKIIQKNLSLFFEKYVARLRQHMETTQLTLYPGIRQLLAALAENEEVCLGLLTGNIKEGARIKLTAFRLEGYFPVGAFGDDSPDRNELPPIALKRASAHYSREFRGADVVIIGDTPHDIRCASSIGARTIAVATGSTPLAELRENSPDFLFPDFGDYRKAVQAIVS